MAPDLKNQRICVYSSQDPMFQDSELPAHFTVGAILEIGAAAFGSGDLSVTNKRIVFVPSEGSAVSFDYKSMVMHAVTTAESGKHIFVQLLADEDDEEEAEDEVLRIFPNDHSSVYPLFEAINEMSALNPDESMSDDDDAQFDEADGEDVQ